MRSSYSPHLAHTIVARGFENAVSFFYCRHGSCWGYKDCVIILFSTPSWSLSFQSSITPGEALTNRLAEWDRCSFMEAWQVYFFFSCLITSETFLCFLINSLLPKTNTALENHLIASVLGYMSNLMNISKSHFFSRWPVGVVSSTVILNCLLFLCNILLHKYLEKRLLIVPSSGDPDILFKNIFG